MEIAIDSIEILVESLNKLPGIKVTLEYNTEDYQKNASPLFKDYAQYWLKTYCLGKVKSNTYIGTYQEPVDLHLIPYFGDYHLKDIKPDDVQLFFNQKVVTSSLESQKKMKSCLKSIFSVACTNEVCNINPVTSTLKLRSNVPPKIKYVWTQKQYDVAWNYAKKHKHGLDLLILMETAISKSELLGLHRADHDNKNSLLHIQRGRVATKDPTTGKYIIIEEGVKNKYRQRVIPLSKELNAAIFIHLSALVNPSHIIYSSKGCACRPDNWYKRVLIPFMKDLHNEHPDVPMLTTHELRHTRATLLKNQGVDVFSIARLLGHCDLDMLAKRYVHDDVDALRSALNLS